MLYSEEKFILRLDVVPLSIKYFYGNFVWFLTKNSYQYRSDVRGKFAYVTDNEIIENFWIKS